MACCGGTLTRERRKDFKGVLGVARRCRDQLCQLSAAPNDSRRARTDFEKKTCYVDGQRWDFVVSHEDIGNSPRWLDTDDSDWSPDSQGILYAIGPAQPDVVERAEGVTA